MSDDDNSITGFTAPYVSWGSFNNLLDRMNTEGLPMRIDRSYLNNMAGSTQSHLLKALRELNLIDEGAAPTEALKALTDPDTRPARIAELVRRHYAEAVGLGTNATQSMLEELFSEKYNVRSSTRSKSIAFFLAAAKYGEVPVSQHFKPPKRIRANGSGSKRPKSKGSAAVQEEEPPPSSRSKSLDGAKAAYVDLLLKKAASEEEMNEQLLDRIERVIGFDGGPKTSSPNSTPGGDVDS